MPVADELANHFSRLTDEELLAQLAEDGLTEEATQRARNVLVARGVNIEQATSELRAAEERAAIQRSEAHDRPSSALRRVLRFPLRALLGIESPWIVLVVGAAAAYPVFWVTAAVTASLLVLRPLPAYAAPLAYAALAVFELAQVWLGVSLWRCARKSDLTLVVWFMRILGAVMLLGAVSSSVGLADFIRQAATEGRR